MATKAVVIKMCGDLEWSRSMSDALVRVVEMDESKIAAIKDECNRLRAINEIRMHADTVRLEIACRALDEKYAIEEHGRLYNTLLVAWGVIWYCIFAAYDYFSAWNREA